MFVHPRLAMKGSVLLLFVAWITLTTASVRSKRGAGWMGSQLNVEKMLTEVDANNDDVVSVAEYATFFQKYDTNGDSNITRCEWTSRNVVDYDDSKLAALSYYDLFDVDSDNMISQIEINVMGYDADNNDVVTVEELRSGINKENGLSKESEAYKIFDYLASQKPATPKITSTLKIDLIVESADKDKDGTVTRPELQNHFISDFDENDDFKVTRCEFVGRSVTRYGDRKEVANVAFDGLDSNNNNYIDIDDIKLSTFDENGDGKLTAEEFKESVKKSDWQNIKKVYPDATTPPPPPASAGALLIPFLGPFLLSLLQLCRVLALSQ